MSQVNRRFFIGTALAGGVMSFIPSAWAEERPYLKVGFLTDTHVGQARKSCERVEGAFKVFRREGVQAIGHCGDLADWHWPEAYGHYRAIIDETYPDPKGCPELLYVYANHDVLDPEKQGTFGPERQMDPEKGFRDMQSRLRISHWVFHETTIACVPFLVIPQFWGLIAGDIKKGWEGIRIFEDKLKEICKAHPTGPIVLMTHLPPKYTTYNSGQWGDPYLAAILSKYPRVIAFSGHVHNSLRNEQCVWQGGYTVVDVGCLQVWQGPLVGTTDEPSKQAYEVLVAEFFASKVVIRRFDVRDGREISPDRPWVVALPFSAKTAPLAPSMRAKSERRGEFPKDAALKISTDAANGTVVLSFPAVKNEEDVLWYRAEVCRQTGDGWERIARADIHSGFYLRPADRPARHSVRFSSSVFESGGRCRVQIVPVGFFGAEGTVLASDWTASAQNGVNTVLVCEDPMKELGCFCYLSGRMRKPDGSIDRHELKFQDGWREMKYVTVFELPDFAKGPKGTEYRIVLDVRTRLKSRDEGSQISLVSLTAKNRGSSRGWTCTPGGDSGLMRYVLRFTSKSDAEPVYGVQFHGGGEGTVRIERVKVEEIIR